MVVRLFSDEKGEGYEKPPLNGALYAAIYVYLNPFIMVESNVKWPKKTFFYLNGLDGGECRKMYPRLVFGVVGGTA